jgi:hypothetical protein
MNKQENKLKLKKINNSGNFSKIKNLSLEKSPIRHSDLYPHLKRYSNIKWLRDRSSNKVIENSLNSYYKSLSDLDQNKINEEAKREKEKKCPRTKRIENSRIRTDYLFTQSKMDDLIKLRELFHQFDRDKSSNYNFYNIFRHT